MCLHLLAIVAGLAFAQLERPHRYSDIPYVATPQEVVERMLDLAGLKEGDVLIDLGSGDGRIVLAAAKRGAHATGVEIDPELVEQSRRAARQAGVSDRAEFVKGDLFEYDLRRATVVTMYLTPGVNLRLRPKLRGELKPGTRVVSHRFNMGSWQPDKTAALGDDRLYLWVIRDEQR